MIADDSSGLSRASSPAGGAARAMSAGVNPAPPSIMLMSMADRWPGLTAARLASAKISRIRCQYRVMPTWEGCFRYSSSRARKAPALLSACTMRSRALALAFTTIASACPRL